MPRPKGYPTPDMPSSVIYTTRCVTLPDIPEFIALIGGLLFEATRQSFWIETGTMTAQEAADLVADSLAQYDAQEECNLDTTPVGAMVTIPHDSVPDKWLLCHGTNILDRVDYPELYDLLTEFQIDADTFALPNMSNTFVLGYSSVVEPVGAEGGAGTVTLNLNNIPPHAHTQNGMNSGGAQGRILSDTLGNGVAVARNASALAGGAGGAATSFEIIPPYMRLKYIIKALP